MRLIFWYIVIENASGTGRAWLAVCGASVVLLLLCVTAAGCCLCRRRAEPPNNHMQSTYIDSLGNLLRNFPCVFVKNSGLWSPIIAPRASIRFGALTRAKLMFLRSVDRKTRSCCITVDTTLIKIVKC